MLEHIVGKTVVDFQEVYVVDTLKSVILKLDDGTTVELKAEITACVYEEAELSVTVKK